MVEKQVRAGGPFVTAGMIAFATVSFAIAAENPRGLDRGDDELGRSLTTLPSSIPETPFSTKDRSSSDAPKRGNPLWGISIDSLDATRERPLFSPTRRAPMPPAVAPPPEPPKIVAAPPEPEQPALSLVGIVAGHGEGYAVFISTSNHDIVRLRTGEGRDGWVLRSVSGREAVLEKNNQTAVVELPPLTGDFK